MFYLLAYDNEFTLKQILPFCSSTEELFALGATSKNIRTAVNEYLFDRIESDFHLFSYPKILKPLKKDGISHWMYLARLHNIKHPLILTTIYHPFESQKTLKEVLEYFHPFRIMATNFRQAENMENEKSKNCDDLCRFEKIVTVFQKEIPLIIEKYSRPNINDWKMSQSAISELFCETIIRQCQKFNRKLSELKKNSTTLEKDIENYSMKFKEEIQILNKTDLRDFDWFDKEIEIIPYKQPKSKKISLVDKEPKPMKTDTKFLLSDWKYRMIKRK